MQKERSMNDNIEIKLTSTGFHHIVAESNKFQEKFPAFWGDKAIYSTFIKEPEAWHKVQFHELFCMFGDIVYPGASLPFTWRLPPEPFTDHECVDG